MKIDKNLIGTIAICTALGLWISFWFSMIPGIVVGLGYFGYYLMTLAEEEDEKKVNPAFIPSCDKENDIHTFSEPKKGSLCHCCVRKWGG